jgi:hypothetical protein
LGELEFELKLFLELDEAQPTYWIPSDQQVRFVNGGGHRSTLLERRRRVTAIRLATPDPRLLRGDGTGTERGATTGQESKSNWKVSAGLRSD